MSFLDYAKDVRTMVVQAPTTGTNSTSLASQTVDMAGFNTCTFITTIEASSVLTTQVAWGSTSTTAGDFAVLNYNSSTVSTAQTTTSSKGCLITTVHRPTRRYLKLIVESTGVRPHGGTLALLYNASVKPTTNSSTDVHAATSVVSS